MYKYREREKRRKSLKCRELSVVWVKRVCKTKCNIDITFM